MTDLALDKADALRTFDEALEQHRATLAILAACPVSAEALAALRDVAAGLRQVADAMDRVVAAVSAPEVQA